MSNTLGNLDWSNPATVIAFAVDNNPQAVATEMLARDYKIQGLSIDQYKDLLMLAYEKGLDLTWIGKIQYMPTAGNWTGELYRQTIANSGAKFTWGTLGQVLMVAGTTLAAIFGVNATGSGNPTPAPTPQNDTIMGMSKDLFYPLMMILLVIIVLVIFVVMRKK